MAGGSGKTVEEVARDLVDNGRWSNDDGEVQEDWLMDLIKSALRQREQETAASCALLADLRAIKALRDEGWANTSELRAEQSGRHECAVEIREAIESRFPKDQG